MTYFFKYEHFDTLEDRLVFKPNINPFDYEVQQLILEAERIIGALARLGPPSYYFWNYSSFNRLHPPFPGW